MNGQAFNIKKLLFLKYDITLNVVCFIFITCTNQHKYDNMVVGNIFLPRL